MIFNSLEGVIVIMITFDNIKEHWKDP